MQNLVSVQTIDVYSFGGFLLIPWSIFSLKSFLPRKKSNILFYVLLPRTCMQVEFQGMLPFFCIHYFWKYSLQY